MIRLLTFALSILVFMPIRYAYAQVPQNGPSWKAPVVYSVSLGKPPTWEIEVSATFPATPEFVTMSSWSSFAFEEGWSALVRDVVSLQDGRAQALERTPEGTWKLDGAVGDEPLRIRYTVDLAPVFKAHETLPKTTAPWTDGRSLVMPGFTLFMHSPRQGPFEVEFNTPNGARVDAGWSFDAAGGSFYGSSLDALLQNTFVAGHHQVAEVAVDGFQIKAVPLGRHRDGIDRLAPIVDAHARRFRSLFEYPIDQSYLMVLIDDPWDTGESFPDSFAMAYSTPIQEYNQAAWGKTIAHELFHYWNGGRMQAADWATSQWFSEGMTDYIATRAMVEGGFITAAELFDEMQKHVSFYALFKQGIVYDDLSLVEAGSHKTTHNAAIYDGGWLVAFCIDIIIREQTSNSATIETMIRRLWDLHGEPAGGIRYSNEDVITIGETIGGPEVRQLFDRCIAGKARIPLEEFFERAGLRLVLDAQAAWVQTLPHAPASALRIRDGIVGASTPHDHAALQAHIELALSAFGGDSRPGAVVVVTRDGHVIAEHAVGMANLEHSVPLTTDSVFHVASDAKRFTAAAICRLVERGQLRLEDTVSTHLPETAPLGEQLTIEQLLCHTSGVKDQWSLLAMAGWRPEDVVTHDQVVDLLCRQQSTNFQAGDRQMYSNSGYTLLAEIVARVTGSELGTFLDREFFVPSAMSRTHVRASVAEIVPGRVESYMRDPTGKYVRRPVQYEVLGATSLLTTARDLARWIEAVHAGQALTGFELETMLETRWLPSGDEMTYAFGLFEHDLRGLTAVGHGGADGGFRSYFLRIPESRLGVVVLSNTPEIEPNGLAHQIAEWALGMESEPTESRGPGEPARPDVASFVGTYRGDDGEMVTVRHWFDKLRLWEGAENPGTFSWRENEAVYADANGRVLEFDEDRCRLASEKEIWSGSRVPHPSTEELRAYEGLYHSEELDALFNVRVENQLLIARSPRGNTITLTPAGRDFFDGDTWYCFEIRFTRAASGRVQTMHLSSSRAFDVPFNRRPSG